MASSDMEARLWSSKMASKSRMARFLRPRVLMSVPEPLTWRERTLRPRKLTDSDFTEEFPPPQTTRDSSPPSFREAHSRDSMSSTCFLRHAQRQLLLLACH